MVLLAGPRQVGKSTLARGLLDANGVYLNWDIRKDQAGRIAPDGAVAGRAAARACGWTGQPRSSGGRSVGVGANGAVVDGSAGAALQASGTRIHPARFPAELPRFFIDFLTDPGDLVVDPFAGSNTTGAVAEEMDRRWLAFEIKREYAEASKLRFEGAAEAIAEANGQPSLLS
jgi:hypothetical protein